MRTPFETLNKEYTDKCHKLAQTRIYPILFNCMADKLEFIDTSLSIGEKERIYDGEMGIDRIIKVKVENLRAPLEFTVQERFRTCKYKGRQDVTITEWNEYSNTPSELYKLKSHIFIYGYGNTKELKDEPTELLEALAIDVPRMLHCIATGKLEYSDECNTKRQPFIGIRFSDLRNSDCVMVEYTYVNQTQSELLEIELNNINFAFIQAEENKQLDLFKR